MEAPGSRRQSNNWTSNEENLLSLAVAQREHQCLKQFSGAGFEGPGKVTKASKSQAWDEVAAEILSGSLRRKYSLAVKFSLMRDAIFKSSPADLRQVATCLNFKSLF
jgi:hypothetical protein